MPSQKLKAYIEADRLEKEGKKGKDLVKPYVQKLLKRAKSLGVFLRGVSYQERTSVKFDDIELHAWVKKQCLHPILDENGDLQYNEEGEVLAMLNRTLWADLTKVVIDEEKLEIAAERGIIDLSELPEACYTTTISPTVTIDHRKVNFGT